MVAILKIIVYIYKKEMFESDAGKQKAQYALHTALLNILKLFAPITPHITEEIYHLYFAKKAVGIEAKSLHRTAWPEFNENELDRVISFFEWSKRNFWR